MSTGRKSDEIIDAEIIPEPTKTVSYTVTGYQHPSFPLHYQQQPTYVPDVNAPTSMLAVFSAVLAVLAVPFFWALIPAPLAAITGYFALKRIADGEAGGYKIARFGLILGLIEMGLAVLVIIALAVFSIIAWQTDPNTTKLF